MVAEKPLKELDEKGCTIIRDFFFSPDGEDFQLMMNMMDKGWKELYYTAPYHWALVNIKNKQIYTYTEGDTCSVTCPDDNILLDTADEYIKYIRKNYPKSPEVWADGEILVEELKNKGVMPVGNIL